MVVLQHLCILSHLYDDSERSHSHARIGDRRSTHSAQRLQTPGSHNLANQSFNEVVIDQTLVHPSQRLVSLLAVVCRSKLHLQRLKPNLQQNWLIGLILEMCVELPLKAQEVLLSE